MTRRTVTILPGTSYLLASSEAAGFYDDRLTVSLTADTIPPLDTLQLVRSITTPYGCAEQTASRSFPLLYLASLYGVAEAIDLDQAEIDARIETAVRRLSAMQTGYGSFGIRSWYSNSKPWVDVTSWTF